VKCRERKNLRHLEYFIGGKAENKDYSLWETLQN
jgi:hypothetical protein